MAESIRRPPVGHTAPELQLIDQHGNRWCLDEQRGQTVVLIFHRHIH